MQMVDMGMGKRTHGEPARHAAATALEAAATGLCMWHAHTQKKHTEDMSQRDAVLDATRDLGSMDRAANRERRTSSNPVQRRGSACAAYRKSWAPHVE